MSNRRKKSSTRFYKDDNNVWHIERTTTRTFSGSTKDGSNRLDARLSYIQYGGADETRYSRSLIRIANK